MRVNGTNIFPFESDISSLEKKLYLLGNNMFAFEYDMFPFENDMLPRGNDMSLFEHENFLCGKDVDLSPKARAPPSPSGYFAWGLDTLKLCALFFCLKHVYFLFVRICFPCC